MIRKGTQLWSIVALSVLIVFVVMAIVHGDEVARMSRDELKAMLGKPELIVIDVRSEGDWKSSGSKIQGAVREDPAKTQGWLGNYPKDKTYVLYCA